MNQTLLVEFGRELARVFEVVRQLAAKKFYGSVTLSFQAGRITNVKTEQNHKPEDL